MEKSIDTEKGTLYYAEKEDYITITAYQGNDTEIIVPESINTLPVRKIGKKAFLNSRKLRRLILPDTIKKLGEWALAYCFFLEEVELPRRKITLGKGTFLEDKKLAKITLRERKKFAGEMKEISKKADFESYWEDIAVLLAAVNHMPESGHLFDFKEAGKSDWLKRWDQHLIKYLQESDENGYTQLILCGEEDINCNLELFVKNKRKQKVALCFLRLLHESGIEKETKNIYEDYLISHSIGCSSMETWLVLKEDVGHIREYYEMYVKLGCLNDQNYDATLADLGEKHPEMKAYFMREHGQKKDGNDFFENFEL